MAEIPGRDDGASPEATRPGPYSLTMRARIPCIAPAGHVLGFDKGDSSTLAHGRRVHSRPAGGPRASGPAPAWGPPGYSRGLALRNLRREDYTSRPAERSAPVPRAPSPLRGKVRLSTLGRLGSVCMAELLCGVDMGPDTAGGMGYDCHGG
jgi:hypothetical protein